ncbi:MAG TPA: ABC transporter ATP-binding protein [bacterium]|jgi:putative ABC transport system ATP-binding protein|nr:ABC transporter ATP-binding protein [bacterium]
MIPLIDVKGITKIYNGGEIATKALSDVSFEIEKGEFVAIVGPSGSGKSTLMHILGCLDIPTSGTYIINGRNVENMNDDELANIRNKEIGFVFQAYNLLSRTTSIKNVCLPMIYAGIPKTERYERAKNLLISVGLGNKLFNSPNQLSGGEKQRVAIARSMATEPSIILADEPTGNLASKQSMEIMDIFDELNIKGNTIILITHEENIAKRAKRIISIMDGKIVNDTGRLN